jgi:hypothetical protein
MANWWDDAPLADAAPASGGSSPFAGAISSIESGGNYKAIGPATRTGDRALGKYQIMSANVGPWSEEIIGRKVSPQEFISSPEIQDKIFNGKFGQYAEKYGPEGAAKAWFAGEGGMNDPNRKDVLGTTVAGYAAKFNKALGPTDASAQRKPPAKNWWDDAPLEEQAKPDAAPPQEVASFAARFPAEDEFAPTKKEVSLSDAITDIPKEIGNAAGEALTNIKGIANRGGQGPIEGLVTTGKAALGIPQLIMSPVTGAARSVLGHGLESATNAAGELIAPELAAKRDRQKDYETAKGDVDLAMMAAAPGKVRAPKVSAPTIKELKTAAKADYESPEVKGLVVKPDTIKNYGATVRADLNNQGFDENVAPKTFGILSKLDTIPAGATVTGDNFNSLRKMLGKAAGSIEPAEKAAASMAIERLDNFIPTIPAGDVIAGDVGAAASRLETARGNYSAAKQSEKIDQKLVAAETRAAAANSGMNVANTIRQRMADVVLNPKQARGLLPEEVAAAKAISEGTKTQNVIRGVSNILGGGGGLGTVAAATAGGLATGGPGALAPVAGFALRALSNKLTIRQAEKLSEAIRSRAPLASSAAKYNQAAANLQANRTPQAIAGALIAARNFATNLKGAGFNISPAELLSGMQTTRAEEQQDQGPRPSAE